MAAPDTFIDVIPLLRMPRSARGVFTYRVPADLAPRATRGAFVLVPFRARRLWAVCVAAPATEQPSGAMREIFAVRDDAQLTEVELENVIITAEHFRLSPATVAHLLLPAPPLQATSARNDASYNDQTVNPIATPARVRALIRQAVDATPAGDAIFVPTTHDERIAGIAAFAEAIVGRGRTVLICTPYRAWLPRLARALNHLPLVMLDHTDGMRAQWSRYARARREPCVVLTTRGGALFAPPLLGGIVIDLAHEDDHKSWDMQPKYDVRVMTGRIARTLAIPRLLCSPTPRLEEWGTATQRLRTGERFAPPTIVRLDHFWSGGGKGLLSDDLVAAIRATLDARQDVLLLHNRRGRLGRISCSDCGRVERCTACERPLVEHRSGLHCHVCGTTIGMPDGCSACGSHYLRFRGMGTAGLMDALAQRFPNVPTCRVDRDTPLAPNEVARIVVATERYTNSIAPAEPRVFGLVAVLHAERFVPADEVRSAERLLASLRDVACWANTWGATLLLQTSERTHPVLQALLADDLTNWYREEFSEREALSYPPATRLLRCDMTPTDEADMRTAIHLLTNAHRGTVLAVDGPYEYGVIRGHRIESILVRIRANASDREIASIVRSLPDCCTADLDPLRLHS